MFTPTGLVTDVPKRLLKAGPQLSPDSTHTPKHLLISSSAGYCAPARRAIPPAISHQGGRAERREQRMLEDLVGHRRAEAVVHCMRRAAEKKRSTQANEVGAADVLKQF